MFARPVLENVLVQQVDVLGDLRLPEHLFGFVLADAHPAGNPCGRGGQMIVWERPTFRVAVVDLSRPRRLSAAAGSTRVARTG